MFFLRQTFVQLTRRAAQSYAPGYNKNHNFSTLTQHLWQKNQQKPSDEKESENSRSYDDGQQQQRADDHERQLMLRGSFEEVSGKNKTNYIAMVEYFTQRDIHRRNHVEFIYAALKSMETYGVDRDLEVYKALLNVMPKGKFIPTNMFQAEFMHYPKQQQCIIDLLEQMEDNGVIPDNEMEDMLLNVFGRRGHPVLKFWRMMYWMPKFKNASPWPIPNPVPRDSFELAKIAVERMCTVDIHSKVSIYHTKDVENSIDDTWIVSGISPAQSQLLAEHNKEQPLHIEGPFLIWLREQSITYFTLRSDPPVDPKYEQSDEDLDDVSNIKFSQFVFGTSLPTAVATTKRKRFVHEQDDGTILAICATGTSTKDSLLSWIRALQNDNNPVLADIPVLFKFRTNDSSELAVKAQTTSS